MLTARLPCSPTPGRSDGAVVARNALDRVTLDSGPPPGHIRSGLISYRLHRNALEIMDMIATTPYDPDDR